ncbi:hypothetical protein NUW58_g4442 [Xylaria curta]|uniref:Uncharacterized protein n=1 Tax=Xylaria curta TaxID=42375 RepID=A0ACC1P814_9PEZI|nr:hypothetical protein NUW58_g4442 [Xylaria curta]
MAAIASHAIVSEVKFFHIEGVQMFGKETLEAGLLSVLRIGGVGVDEGKRAQVEKIWEQARNSLSESAGFGHTGGWRIEKDQGREDRDEFVVVGAWRDQDALSRFADDNAGTWGEVWRDIMLDIEVKAYSRIA